MTATAAAHVLARDQRGIVRVLACSSLFLSATLISDVGGRLANGALAALAGAPCTVYPFVTVFDRPEIGLGAAGAVALSGPAFELAVALFGAWLYARARTAAVRWFAIYTGGFAAMLFLSNVMSTAFSGDFQPVAAALAVPAALQWMVSIGGGVLLAIVMWAIGARLAPAASAAVIPFVVATGLRPLAYVPTAWGAVVMMWEGTAPWLIVLASALWRARRDRLSGAAPVPPAVRLWMSAWLLPVLLMLCLRLLGFGIHFGAPPAGAASPRGISAALTRGHVTPS